MAAMAQAQANSLDVSHPNAAVDAAQDGTGQCTSDM